MMKQDSIPTTPTLPTVCGQCGTDERTLLHNVRLRGNFRRLCTTCVLRLHPQCFCPACLGVYERLPPDDAVVCYKCYSASHPSCVPSHSPVVGAIASSGRGPVPCSACLNPNLLVLNVGRVENGGRVGRVIDCGASRLLLAAGKIAAMSMGKAEVAAGMEAERRAKEAAYTKKRAREALDHVVRLMGREKRNVSVNVNVNGNGNGNVNNVVGNVVVSKDDDSNEVLKALNAVELKDNGGVVVDEKAVVMEVDVGGKESGAENGCVKSDDEVVKIAQNGEEDQGVEKMQAVEENDVSENVN
ncbi:hypothetical protein M8C21_011634 [Ambrosia artemisiifolia]|uniref:Uncharacterized protein n=1 Tax=Ambrosia artemisiifolia TaxID=4212 RepID=A0AAD5G8I7_AMBAR|nr:hypothetical protein M8C21_011634 [Ambrosia artemisiifolia]